MSDARKAAPRRKWKLWEIEPGTPTVAGNPIIEVLAASQASAHLADFRRTGNGAHAWRAWRCARHLDPMPEPIRMELYLFLDRVALGMTVADRVPAVAQAAAMVSGNGARGDGNRAFREQASDRDLIVRYRHLLKLDERAGRTPNKAAVRRRLAQEVGTSEGAIKQRILRIEQAGAHATRSRKR